ncbi:MAG: carbohydrate ABC transporter permease, partial [Oscillospiraceae bacterium]|nr:carbohydrate ABC transporter permease [Oscillospiraceae bacterium]
GLIYVLITPLMHVISTSVMGKKDLLDPTTIWIPKNPTGENYLEALEIIDYLPAFRNSFVYSGLITLLQLFSCSIVGYGLARYNFREKKFIFA